MSYENPSARPPTNEDEIDANVVTEDGRNVIGVNGNIVTEDGDNVVRESDGVSIILNDDKEVALLATNPTNPNSAEVFRDTEFQGGTVRTTDDDTDEKRNVATEEGTDVTYSSSFSETEFSTISKIELTVGTGPGADTVDLDDLTIQYLGPDNAVNLISNETADANEATFDVETIRGEEDNVLVDQDDRKKIVIDLLDPDNELGVLAEGEEAHLTIVTASGAQTQVQLTVPSSLTGEAAVNL